MAISSPRVIFAYAIPTIIVILSYIWFKRKKQVPNGPNFVLTCDPASTSRSADDRGEFAVSSPDTVLNSSSKGLLNGSGRSDLTESLQQSESSSVEMVVEIVADSDDSCQGQVEHKVAAANSVATTLSDCSDIECFVLGLSSGEDPSDKCLAPLHCFDTAAMVDDGQDVDVVHSEVTGCSQLATGPELLQACECSDEPNVLFAAGCPEAAIPDKDSNETIAHLPSGKDSGEIAECLSGMTSDEGSDKVPEHLSKNDSYEVIERFSDGVAELTLQNESVDSDLAVPDEKGIEEANSCDGRGGPAETGVEPIAHSNGCHGPVYNGDNQNSATITGSDPSLGLEDAATDALPPNDSEVLDSNSGSASGIMVEEDKQNCVAATVTGGRSVAECELKGAPSVVPSPGLSVDEPELQKLVNGNSTSAYGSASHSPANGLESPTASNYSDLQSEGSSDSGKGGSDIHTPGTDGSAGNFQFTPLQVYEFEIPQDLCGRLIGQRGRYVNMIKNKTNASISVKRHPFNPELKLCAVLGTEEDISAALMLIRKRFPLSKFPVMSMLQVNAPLMNGVPVPDTLQLHLPDGVTCDVILSSLVNAGHFFVQQPTHPTYSSLSRLDQFMLACYMNGMGAPELPSPVEAGIICAASTMGGWYRAQIVYVYPDSDECEVKFVDYGGYSRESISSLRQIRSDFMTLPFQASECFLANVSPIDENQSWTLEASSCFEELAQGQILQAQIVAYSDEGIPYVHLYRIQGVMSTFINQELVNCGQAKWIEHQG